MSNSTTKSSLHQSQFLYWLVHLDRILRGEATRPTDIRKADIKMPMFGIAVLVLLLAAIYGLCMGVFALVSGFENATYQKAMMQTVASMCKVPLLFFLTLLVTFPSLYVFNALVGSKLRGVPVLKLLIASLAVNLSVLASMGPILAFFSVSTPNYPFIVVLNVVVFAIAGLLGLAFLIQTLNRLSNAQSKVETQPRNLSKPATVIPVQPASPQKATDEKVDYYGDRPAAPSTTKDQVGSKKIKNRTGPLDRVEGIVLGQHVRKVFFCWIVLFGLVGAQMGWVLRPFIGAPGKDFSWFRARESNFFEAVMNAIYNMMF